VRKSIKILLFITLATLFLIPLVNDGSLATDSQYNLQDGGVTSGDQDEASWWNSTFLYRRYYNISEPNVSDRSDTPVHLYLTFEDLHCYMDSIRVMYYNSTGGDHWDSSPFQIWNTTYYPGSVFIQSTRVSFTVSVDKGVTDTDYYIYYAKDDVGSVSYPNYYPFIYKSYTFSLINLVSYYDNNNYNIEMYDDPLQSGDSTWKNPNDVNNAVDTRWKNSQVTPDSTPNGALNKYENVRYEPTSSSYDDFWGYYAVYSNYPLAVSMGMGDKGSNSAVNDWYPGVNELGAGKGTKFILGGVEGFGNGRYWIQAQEDNTEVNVWTIAEVLDSGWIFYNSTPVSSWPAVLKAGEYIAKSNVIYSTYVMVNSTKPVSVRSGDTDCTSSRDIGAYFPSTTGNLVGEEFYTIDMSNSNDRTRVTNIGNTTVTVEWWRNTGSILGWVKGANLSIPANNSQDILYSTANPEPILRILGPEGSKLFVEGIYNAPAVSDHGDWAPSMTGDRFGLDYRILVGKEQKVMIIAWADVSIDISISNSLVSYPPVEIPAGGIGYYMPGSSIQTLHDFHSNGTISIVVAGKFYTTTPYKPNGDQGYGWMVPAYAPDGDQAGFIIDSSDEIKLFQFDITVRDLDGLPVAGASVELRYLNDSLWQDDSGLGRSGTTDVNGLIVFEGLSNQTYRISTKIDAKQWLTSSYSHIWVTNTTDVEIDGSVTYVTIQLELADIDIYLTDLMGSSMSDTPDETTKMRLTNGTLPLNNYTAQGQTNSSGWIHFSRVPVDDYDVYGYYTGSLGWSYQWDQMDKFSVWSIGSDEFTSGSFTHNWELPLVTLDIHVVSWDMLDVSGAGITVENTVDSYPIARSSDANGDFSFYRIANGTWNLDVWKDDDYSLTPIARNNTETLDVQDYTPQTIELPLSRLVVRVTTGGSSWVEGAQVNVDLIGVGSIAQGTTNSTGYVTFFNIRANLTGIIDYNVTASSGLEFASQIVRCDKYWSAGNLITILPPTWGQSYSELSATNYFRNVYWGQSINLTISWFNKTGNPSSYTSDAIIYDSTSWLNFTIYHNSIPIGYGSWTLSASDWIYSQSGMIFFAEIDSFLWLMNVSSESYEVVFEAYSSLFPDPNSITVYVTVLPTTTSKGIGTASISQDYGTLQEYLYWLYDTINSSYVSDLDVLSYEVRIGTEFVTSGFMTLNGNGTYSLPDSALSGLGIGSYLLYISFEKKNYINQTITIGVTINARPMEVLVYSPDNYIWSEDSDSESLVFQYVTLDDGTPIDLSDIHVTIEWLTYPGGVSYRTLSDDLSVSMSNITFYYDGNTVPVGSWTVKITCAHTNYTTAAFSFSFIIVSQAPTTLEVPGAQGPVDWTVPVVVTINYTRNGDGVGLQSAIISTNWNDTVVIIYIGNGLYNISFGTTIPAKLYTVTITVSLSNHQPQIDTVDITISTPIYIETQYGSEETPLTAYWTRSFDIVVQLLDTSRDGTVIENATISYIWDLPAPLSDITGFLTEISPGQYKITLQGSQASPLTNEYQIALAVTVGSSSATAIIFLKLQDVPNEISIPIGGFFPYYGDVVTVVFYWNNTLDNESITLPSYSSFVVEPLGVVVSGLINYGNGTYSFEVDTKALGMFVDQYTGFYRIRISMQADGFELVEDVFVFFLMRESPTYMESTSENIVTWSDDITLTVNLWDSRHSEAIWIGASVQVVYNGKVIISMAPLTNPANGTFFVTFNSSLFFASIEPTAQPYDVTIRYSLPNYVDGQIEIDVRVNAIEGQITMITIGLEDGVYDDGLWKNEVAIQVFVSYVRDSSPMPLSDVQYYWVGYESIGGSLSYAGVTYNAVIDTSLVPAGDRTLRIIALLQNHTVVPYDLLMELNPLEADFITETTSLEVIHGSTGFSEVIFTLEQAGSPLTGATIRVSLNSQILPFTFTEIGDTYIVYVRPSLVPGLNAPEHYDLVFDMELNNYTADSVTISMIMLAPTSITVGDSISAEYGKTVTVIFQYLNDLTGLPVPGATVSAFIVTADNTIALAVVVYNSTHYSVDISAADVGEISGDPYTIRFEAFAEDYQAWIGSDTGLEVDFYVREPTYNIPLLGRFPVADVHNTLLLIALFSIIAGSVVLGRRMRIPYQIKQIDKALKQIEKGKTGKVEKIKTIGMVISELLAPGLAELDIEAPIIESGPEDTYEQILDDDTEDLLGELDALDDVGLEEESDFEAELDAELDAISEEEPILKQAEPESEPEPVPEVETEVEDIDEPEGTESNLEFDEPKDEEVEAEEVEPEPEETEAAVESESEVEEVEPVDKIIEDESAENTAEVEEVIETDSEYETTEEPVEEIVESPEKSIAEPETSDEETSKQPKKQLTQAQMIELLPPEIREKYPIEDLRKLTISELQELLDFMDE